MFAVQKHEVSGLGIEIRTGIHTGEVEVRGEDIGGIAVHLAKRVESLAAPGDEIEVGAGGE